MESKQSLAFDFRCFKSNLRFEVRKETSDLAEYFPPFKTQIGPEIKKMASDYFSASLPNKFEARLPKRGGGPLPVCKNGCGASLKQDFFTVFASNCV